MNRIAHTLAHEIWRARAFLAAAALAVTIVSAWQLPALNVSNSLEIWYPESDPALARYRQFQQKYGSDEFIVVVADSNGALDFSSEDGLVHVADLTDALLDVSGVATVTSLVTVPASMTSAQRRLLSRDATTTAFIVQTIADADFESQRNTLLAEIRTLVGNAGFSSYLGGYGVVFEGLNEASTSGAAMLIVSAHLAMIVLLYAFFRRALPVLVTLSAVAAATVCTMALYVGTGHEINMITMVLPTLVLVIGIADCMHILRAVALQPRNKAHALRVVDGVASVLAPCFLTSITTAAGFLGLTLSGLPVVQQLGWFGAAGILIAYVLAIVLVTAALTWPQVLPRIATNRPDRLALRLHDVGRNYPGRVLLGFSVLAIVSSYGVTMLVTDTDSIRYLEPSHTVRSDSDFIEERIGAYVPIEFTISSATDLLTEEHLEAIWAWQRRVEQTAPVEWSWSILDVAGLDSEVRPSSVGLDRIRVRLQRMRRFAPAVVAGMLPNESELRVSFGAPIMSAAAVGKLIEQILRSADFPRDLVLVPAGYSPLYTRIVDEIVTSQTWGFGAAILLIVVFLGIAMRSAKTALLAFPANAIPVGATLGLMGLTGIPLDVATATIASVILGLVVDDSVYLLRPAPGMGIAAALRRAAMESGGTLIMTSVVLAAGFVLLGLADIRSIVWFGTLTAFAVICAIATDLLLLPALARLPDRAREINKYLKIR